MKRILSILTAAAVISSCSFLDETPSEYLTPEYLFVDDTWAEQNLRMAFSYLPSGFNSYGGSFLDAATDDAAYRVDNASINLISRAKLSLANPGEGFWSDGYKGIRRSMYFQKYIHLLNTIPSFTDEEVQQRKMQWKAEAQTLEAFYYFELIKRYGGVPIVKEVINTEDEAKSYSRSSFSDCVEHIVELCDKASENLEYSSVFGRVSKGAALAIKAKTLAYAASDLFNNASDKYCGYVDGSQSERQDRAAKALAAVINLEDSGKKVYKLISDYSKIETDVTASNTEIIFSNPRVSSTFLESNLYPPSLKGNGGTFPSQNLVDAYEYTSAPSKTNPYANRDPRFGMTILYDGGTLGARGIIYTREGSGVDALNSVKEKSTITGYYLRKGVNPAVNFTLATPAKSTNIFPIIRLADILLLYAEMANEAYGPDSDPNNSGITALDAINEVRTRTSVGLERLKSGITKEELRTRIRNERRIELAFEDQRYFDVRRWKIAEDVLNQPLRGMRITNSDGTLDYSEITVDELRAFDEKMYLSPIPYSEIKANSNLVQNPGWNQ